MNEQQRKSVAEAIATARVENYCKLFLSKKYVRVTLEHFTGNIVRLRYAPIHFKPAPHVDTPKSVVAPLVAIIDANIGLVEFQDQKHPDNGCFYRWFENEPITISYWAGFTEPPQDLMDAVSLYATWLEERDLDLDYIELDPQNIGVFNNSKNKDSKTYKDFQRVFDNYRRW